MKNFLLLCGALFFLVFSSDVSAHFNGKGHVHEISKKVQNFLNKNCAETATCDLKRFTVTSMVYEVWFADEPFRPTYGNSAIFEYETTSLDSLEKYAIVQFMRGGVFHSARDADGNITKYIGSYILSFGEKVPFFFPEWVIDSRDEDPAYNSDPEDGRFFYLRWNRVSGSYELKTQVHYGTEKPKYPLVYLSDYPGGAFLTGSGAQNTAMQFKTCVFRASEVPHKTTRDNLNFAKPLACFEWQNFNLYDFNTGKYMPMPADINRLYDELELE